MVRGDACYSRPIAFIRIGTLPNFIKGYIKSFAKKSLMSYIRFTLLRPSNNMIVARFNRSAEGISYTVLNKEHCILCVYLELVMYSVIRVASSSAPSGDTGYVV